MDSKYKQSVQEGERVESRRRGVERGQAAQTVQIVRGRDKAGMGRGQVGA